MPAERYYTPSSLLEKNSIELKENEFHHLAHVMRAKEGDKIELVNGLGSLAEGYVQLIKKNCAEIFIENIKVENKQPDQLFLFQAICQQNKLDFIIEKGTELGVDHFFFFPGDLSGKKEWFPNQNERAKALLIAAIKQSGRLFLPQMTVLPKIQEWVGLPSSTFFGDVHREIETLWQILQDKKSKFSLPLAFVTGPESGFTDKEEAKLKQLGAQGVSLHKNILRAETASLTALSLLSAFSNET